MLKHCSKYSLLESSDFCFFLIRFQIIFLKYQIVPNTRGGGGGSNPIFAHGKMCFPIFSHGEKWGKKYMEREGNEYFSLSFHILFFPFSPWGKMGKHTFFHGQKWGWTPPNTCRIIFSGTKYI